MKYYFNRNEVTETEILDILFENLKPNNPTTISHLFYDLPIGTDCNPPDDGKYHLEAKMIKSGLLTYSKTTTGQYFFTLKLTPNGLIALQENDNKYSKYLLSKEQQEQQIREQNKIATTTNISFNNSGTSIQSGHGSSLSDFNKPATHTTTNISPTKPPKRSVLEIFNWIIGIIVGLLALYEFVLKKFFN